MDLAKQYQNFISWQCRVRKQSVREMGGRLTAGMSAGLYSVNGGDEQARINFMIVRKDSEDRTNEFRHIVRKSQDSAEWVKNGLRILSELHYHETDAFENQLTALFSVDSSVADALEEAGQCHLKFKQDSIDFEFDFSVEGLAEDHELFQATYWHNHLFNPTLPGKVRVLAFTPRLLTSV
ncbi:MAG: hypothetical protein AAF353_12625 [Pseudomonadota bacterium]